MPSREEPTIVTLQSADGQAAVRPRDDAPASVPSAIDIGTGAEAEIESVQCCVCGIPGELRYEFTPLGVVRCPRCSLVFASPRLGPAALQRLYDEPAYFDGGVYGQGSRSPAMLLQRIWTAGRLATVAATAPPPARLLEIGSGYGHFLDAARRVGYQVRGVELSRAGVRHARNELGLEVFRGQLGDLPRGETRADVVCCWDTLEHVPDPLAFLRQVRARMTSDGVLALSVPYVNSIPARLLGRRWWTLKPEQHIWHFTPQTLRLVAARAGFVLTSVQRSPVRRANAGRFDSLVAVGRPLSDAG